MQHRNNRISRFPHTLVGAFLGLLAGLLLTSVNGNGVTALTGAIKGVAVGALLGFLWEMTRKILTDLLLEEIDRHQADQRQQPWAPLEEDSAQGRQQ